ncbi:hypothetical protein EDB86DRAFT_2963473 [Lactarius hatsudake]|nr:hypothetical protein EDB86DRAFT_2963473 [Lactarius hatsudake]
MMRNATYTPNHNSYDICSPFAMFCLFLSAFCWPTNRGWTQVYSGTPTLASLIYVPISCAISLLYNRFLGSHRFLGVASMILPLVFELAYLDKAGTARAV